MNAFMHIYISYYLALDPHILITKTLPGSQLRLSESIPQRLYQCSYFLSDCSLISSNTYGHLLWTWNDTAVINYETTQ